MKATESTLRTGEYNQFDKGFQADMDYLCEAAYEGFDK
jgi:leucyl-tRNA synthetase